MARDVLAEQPGWRSQSVCGEVNSCGKSSVRHLNFHHGSRRADDDTYGRSGSQHATAIAIEADASLVKNARGSGRTSIKYPPRWTKPL
jgi:hypothetical protein